MRRLLTVGLLLIAAGLFTLPAAAQGSEQLSKQSNCPVSFELPMTVECDRVAVPEDHRNPDGPTIQIAYARLVSTAPKPARTSALFGTAPLAGVMLSLVVFHDPLSLPFLGALVLVIGAIAVMMSERHGHSHTHEAITHEHIYNLEDVHHTLSAIRLHALKGSYSHTHLPIEHDHPHLPDIHHRHAH